MTPRYEESMGGVSRRDRVARTYTYVVGFLEIEGGVEVSLVSGGGAKRISENASLDTGEISFHFIPVKMASQCPLPDVYTHTQNLVTSNGEGAYGCRGIVMCKPRSLQWHQLHLTYCTLFNTTIVSTRTIRGERTTNAHTCPALPTNFPIHQVSPPRSTDGDNPVITTSPPTERRLLYHSNTALLLQSHHNIPMLKTICVDFQALLVLPHYIGCVVFLVLEGGGGLLSVQQYSQCEKPTGPTRDNVGHQPVRDPMGGEHHMFCRYEMSTCIEDEHGWQAGRQAGCTRDVAVQTQGYQTTRERRTLIGRSFIAMNWLMFIRSCNEFARNKLSQSCWKWFVQAHTLLVYIGFPPSISLSLSLSLSSQGRNCCLLVTEEEEEERESRAPLLEQLMPITPSTRSAQQLHAFPLKVPVAWVQKQQQQQQALYIRRRSYGFELCSAIGYITHVLSYPFSRAKYFLLFALDVDDFN
ncbi:hypothetical protein B566_EDAN010364 [Ephemera danica]|nr:hypothetical protein B566_EDAN010364 [Ephemera danica]